VLIIIVVVQLAGDTIIGDIQSDRVSFNLFILGNQNLSANQFFLQTSGSLYLLPEPVPDNGVVFLIKSFGYYSDEDRATFFSFESPTMIFDAYLFIVVFRPEGESLRLIHGPVEMNHFLSPGMLTVDWPVQRGDLVGALVPSSCINESGIREGELRIGCPSHIDLRADPWSCSSALHYPVNTDLGLDKLEIIPVDQFKVVQVHLNMEASISSSGMSI
jgi:hypothetical protein